MQIAIECKSVCKTFPGGTQALDRLSLAVSQHEFVSVLGPSGCGKSTLLRLISGLINVSSGEILIDGQRVTGPGLHIGMVFQNAVLLPWLKILENVQLPLAVRKSLTEDGRRRARELLQLVGLAGFETNYPYQLSGGMQQRVAICRSLIHDPKLLLMDEPFGALDALTREQMNFELQRIWMETRKTVLLITHSISEAVLLSDRVVVLTSRPAKVAKIIDVRLPRPRTIRHMQSPEAIAATDEARALLFQDATMR